MPLDEVTCGDCGESWQAPRDLSPDTLEAAVLAAHGGNSIDAMKQVRAAWPMAPGSAQRLVRHFARAGRLCNACDAPLSGDLVTSCGGCNSINYDPQGATPYRSDWDGHLIPRAAGLRPSLAQGHQNLTEAFQVACIQFIAAQWDSLRPDSRGWAVWIVQHAPLPEGTSGPTGPTENVWLLTSNEIAARDPSEYARFQAVQVQRPWCQASMSPEPNPVFGRTHEIALASFAQFERHCDFYVAYQWGGLFGRGWRCRVTQEGRLQLRRVLWVS